VTTFKEASALGERKETRQAKDGRGGNGEDDESGVRKYKRVTDSRSFTHNKGTQKDKQKTQEGDGKIRKCRESKNFRLPTR